VRSQPPGPPFPARASWRGAAAEEYLPAALCDVALIRFGARRDPDRQRIPVLAALLE